MSKKILAAGALSLGLLGGAVGIAGATSSRTPDATVPSSPTADAPTGRRPLLQQVRRHELEVAATTIGVTPDELRSNLRAGQSIAEVATAKHVDPDTVVHAVVADLTDRIEKAVTDGKVARRRADRVESRLETVVARVVQAHRAPRSK